MYGPLPHFFLLVTPQKKTRSYGTVKAYKSFEAYNFFYQLTCARCLLLFSGRKQGVFRHPNKDKQI